MRDVGVVGAGGVLEITSPEKSMERRARASLVAIPPFLEAWRPPIECRVKYQREDGMLKSLLTKERVSI